jgi:hypothetical protein
MEALRDCTGTYTGMHMTIEVYKRRWQNLFRKTFWFRCFKCEGQWRHYSKG